jgi:hypothetical protein
MKPEQWLEENLPDILLQTDGARGGWVVNAGSMNPLHFDRFPTAEQLVEAAKSCGGFKECKRCGSKLRGGFCSDETCPFSDHIQTCAQVNAPSSGTCTCHTRIIALFVPQAEIGKRIQDCDEDTWRRFDVTDAILAMGQEKALALQDDQYETDELLPEDVKGGWDGPFRVVVERAIENYFDREYVMGEQESMAGVKK